MPTSFLGFDARGLDVERSIRGFVAALRLEDPWTSLYSDASRRRCEIEWNPFDLGEAPASLTVRSSRGLVEAREVL